MFLELGDCCSAAQKALQCTCDQTELQRSSLASLWLRLVISGGCVLIWVFFAARSWLHALELLDQVTKRPAALEVIKTLNK